jgi:hypothetical protein
MLIDKSSNSRGKIEHIFVPTLKSILDYYVLGITQKPQHPQHYSWACEALESDKSLYRKYIFWKGKLSMCPIIVRTIKVKKEPNYLTNSNLYSMLR